LQLEFKSFIKRLNLNDENIEKEQPVVYQYEISEKINLHDMKDETVTIVYSSEYGKFLVYADSKSTVYTIDNNDILNNLLSDGNIKKICFNLKDILHKVNFHDSNLLKNYDDVMIAAYVLDSTRGSYDFDSLVISYLNIDISNIKNKSAETQAVILKKLYDEIIKLINFNGCEYVYNQIELPLIPILYEMEKEGFRVDRESLNEYKRQIEERIKEIESKIYEMAGESFNINSPKQLSYILFEKLKLPVVKRTKTGYSTDAEVLDELYDKHEIIKLVLDFRMYSKILTTYCYGLMNAINEKTGRVHTNFIQTGTATGRLSSSEPNLQNIPIKYDEGKLIRKSFVADDGKVLIDADYSQIELRILAHISNDDGLINAFKNNVDIHTQTAAEIFGVSLDDVTPIMRSQAKAVNFGIVYGISDYGLSRDIKIPVKDASEYIKRYFERYPKVKEYLDDVVKFARENGYVLTIYNRKRYIKDIKSSNKNLRSYAERIAMNSPIQGSAADIMKIAMIKVYKKLKQTGIDAKIILQVHDELLIEVAKKDKDVAKQIVKDEMENAAKLKVPLVVETKEGVNWYETK